MSSSRAETVLVVMRGEHAAFAQKVHTRLRKAGYAVLEASTVAEGWKQVLNEDLDAAVVSIDLPVVFGWELLERMRNDRRFDRIPVITLAQAHDPIDAKRAHGLAADYLAMPFTAEDIESMLAAAITEAQRSEMRSVRVLILTDICEIEGDVHLPPELDRFSDGWEAIVGDHRSFVPVTDARVSTLDGKRLVATTSFMQVTKSQVRGVLPLDAAVDDGDVARHANDDSARLISRLTRVAAGLAKELAEERKQPVEQMLTEFVHKVGDDPELEEPPAPSTPAPPTPARTPPTPTPASKAAAEQAPPPTPASKG